KTNMQHAIQREIEKGRLQPKAASYELEATEHLDALKPAGLVIEAIVERIDAKHAAFRAMSGLVADDCVLATNTSSLSIASIASAASIPERVLGVHFFNPAPVLPLVEIVPWLRTADEVTTQTRALVDSWKKTTVIASDTPGFIVNRVARPF